MRRILLIVISTVFCFSIHSPVLSQEVPSQLFRAVSVSLNNPYFKNEFGLLDKQMRDLRPIVAEFEARKYKFRDSLMVEYNRLKSEGAGSEILSEELESARSKLAEDEIAQAEKFKKAIERILVPSQLKKITQLEFAFRKGAYGSPFVLFGKAYSELGMNPEEEKEARAKLAELKKKYIKEYEKLNKSILEDMKRSLSKEHAEKLEDLIGENAFLPIN